MQNDEFESARNTPGLYLTATVQNLFTLVVCKLQDQISQRRFKGLFLASYF